MLGWCYASSRVGLRGSNWSNRSRCIGSGGCGNCIGSLDWDGLANGVVGPGRCWMRVGIDDGGVDVDNAKG